MSEPIPADPALRPRAMGFTSLLHGIGAFKERRKLKAARWAADAELLRRGSPPLRLAWRVEELVTPKNRLELARTLRFLVRDSSPRYLPSASPVNRLAVRAEAETFEAIAARLAALDQAVAARGVLLVDRLLVDGFGPLYDREGADYLPRYLDRALAALEPR